MKFDYIILSQLIGSLAAIFANVYGLIGVTTLMLLIVVITAVSLLLIQLEHFLDMQKCCGKYGLFNSVLLDDNIKLEIKIRILDKIQLDLEKGKS